MLRHPMMRGAKGALMGALVSTGLLTAAGLAVGAEPSNSWAFTDEKGPRANSVTLNGAWEFAVGDGTEAAETLEGAGRLQWKAVTLPDSFMKWSDEAATKTRFVWARRDFSVTAEQAGRLAVLCWNHITFGAIAWINGRKVGENAPTGPYQVLLPPDTLKAGRNTILLKVAGGAGVARAKSGSSLVPAGFASGDARGMPAVDGDVWIDFADAAYMKWILALPDVSGSKVRIRVTSTGFRRIEGLMVSAEVRSWPDGIPAGRGEAAAVLDPDSKLALTGTPEPLGGAHTFVEVPMPGFKPWTYEEPNLYTARVKLARAGKTLDEATIRFGMREIVTAGGHYLLNGKTLRLRGSELVFEWQWASDRIGGKERDYLVTEAREMSMNAFRTHTTPPPPLWADICDENGTMLLVEFPVLYNYQDYKFTPEEYAIWHRNALLDAAGWMSQLWNHPAVVLWVLSNESNLDNEWEAGPYHDFVRSLDPTRPTLRTGTTGTAENYDVHHCDNTVSPVEGELISAIPSWFHEAKGRPVTNSEYMNIFDRPLCQWTGSEDKAADAWFRRRGLSARRDIDRLVPGSHAVVIWNPTHLTAGEKRRAKSLREFAGAGGRVVVLATASWDWTELCEVEIGHTRGSRVFPYPGVEHPLLAGIEAGWLSRWNGLPGTVVADSLEGPALAGAEKLLWVREPKNCVAAEVPVAGGKGTILFSQLAVQGRLDPSSPSYDAVAERVLINILQGKRR